MLVRWSLGVVKMEFGCCEEGGVVARCCKDGGGVVGCCKDGVWCCKDGGGVL